MTADDSNKEIISTLEGGRAAGVYSGAQAAWEIAGRVEVACAGTTRADSGATVGPRTWFDIASLTKVFTASAALRLIARGAIALSDRLRDLVPDLGGSPQGGATLEQVLAHEAGFADWAPLFEAIDPRSRGVRDGADAMIGLVRAVPPAGDPGGEAVYSDLGFIVLGRALELITGDRLEAIVAREVAEPLGLNSVHYRRSTRMSEHENIAATEDCPWRGRVLQGEVHDDNAWAVGGVAGHAGLFAAASDVARLGAAWLAALDGGGWLPPELARRAVERRPLGRGLGWDLKSDQGSSAGTLMGPRTFGHLGFTGCSLWVDPDRELSVALLTNRVHPSRSNEGIRELRPAFHDVLVGALDSST
jgi:CubicO group peptidase (beta-lactamase class C family)